LIRLFLVGRSRGRMRTGGRERGRGEEIIERQRDENLCDHRLNRNDEEEASSKQGASIGENRLRRKV